MKISLAGWSIHRRFMNKEKPLPLIEFPRLAKEEFGFEAVELNSPFFESTDDSYLERLRSAAQDAGVLLVGMAVDGTGEPASLNEEARQSSVEQIKKWFAVSKRLGLPYFRANTGGYGNEQNGEAVNQCIKSFRELAHEAERTGVKIVIENHGGISANPDTIVRIMEEVGSKWIGTLPDFGNFADSIRYEGLRKIATYAVGVHAKMFEFDAAGEDIRIDIGRCVRIVKDSGFQGYWGIEYEGSGDDHNGVLKAKALLERHLI